MMRSRRIVRPGRMLVGVALATLGGSSALAQNAMPTVSTSAPVAADPALRRTARPGEVGFPAAQAALPANAPQPAPAPANFFLPAAPTAAPQSWPAAQAPAGVAVQSFPVPTAGVKSRVTVHSRPFSGLMGKLGHALTEYSQTRLISSQEIILNTGPTTGPMATITTATTVPQSAPPEPTPSPQGVPTARHPWLDPFRKR